MRFPLTHTSRMITFSRDKGPDAFIKGNPKIAEKTV